MYKILILKEIDKKFIKEWQLLWDKAENANIFNSYEWFQTSMELNEKKEYEIIVCYQKERLVAVLPLQQCKVFGIKVFGTINKEHLIDTAFLTEKYDKRLFKKIFSIILDRSIYLQKVDEKDIKIMHDIFPNFFYSLISVNPIMNLCNEPYSTVTPSTLNHIKRIIRKNPGLRFEMYHTNLDKHMSTMFKLHEKSSKKVRSMDIFDDSHVKNYYVTLTKKFARAMRIGFLYYENEPIAYQFGFTYRDIFVGDQIGYHNDYKRLSPGKTIIYLMVEYLKRHKINFLDEGGGISTYKMEFAKEYRLLYNIYYSPNMFIMIWWKTINKIRRIKQLMFPKKFTRDHEFLFKSI